MVLLSSSLESQRKGVIGDRVRELTQEKLLLPTDSLVVSLMGTFKVYEMCACQGQRRGRRRGRHRCAPQRVLCLEVFISPAGGDLRGGFRKWFWQNISVFQVSSFTVMVFTVWSVPG